ncbi:MAG: hypothetical protein C5B50_04895 [Verrucomicrobia bacterium]|nr:MAG: hypothetical protein C5B50_04895 [Verrucomicrobiota bacterium]
MEVRGGTAGLYCVLCGNYVVQFISRNALNVKSVLLDMCDQKCRRPFIIVPEGRQTIAQRFKRWDTWSGGK